MGFPSEKGGSNTGRNYAIFFKILSAMYLTALNTYINYSEFQWFPVFCKIFPKLQQPYRLLYFAKYFKKYGIIYGWPCFAKHSLLFLLTFNRSKDFTHISHLTDFTYMWSILFKTLAEKILNIKTFITLFFFFFFYKKPLFQTIFKLQIFFWAFKCALWS